MGDPAAGLENEGKSSYRLTESVAWRGAAKKASGSYRCAN